MQERGQIARGPEASGQKHLLQSQIKWNNTAVVWKEALLLKRATQAVVESSA